MPDPGAPPPLSTTPQRSRGWAGWAAYLGISWTWCIGMFLPILLMRDFGVWGFVVFAIPNVIGAAAMGWALHDKRDAGEICDSHRFAVRLFSCVTIAFHCFWLGWMLSIVAPDGLSAWPHLGDNNLIVYPISLATAALVIGALVLRGRPGSAAWILWSVSLALGAHILQSGAWSEIKLDAAGLFRVDAPGGGAGIFFLAPVCVFGFLFCPYLDATFLHARSQLDARASRLAFGAGFGFFFLTMILLTLGYSAALETCIRLRGSASLLPRISMALVPHFLLQSVFTILVHLRTIPGGVRRPHWPWAMFTMGCVGLLILGLSITPSWYHGITHPEVIYRAFMAFYGLVFPAYVWLCMIPTRDGHRGLLGSRGRRKLAILLGVIVIAAPFYWMGFIERQTWFLAPGLGVVLASRLLVMGRRKIRPGEPGEMLRGGA